MPRPGCRWSTRAAFSPWCCLGAERAALDRRVRATDRLARAGAEHKRRIKDLVRQLMPMTPLGGDLGAADMAVLERFADPNVLGKAGEKRLAAVIAKASNNHRGAGRARERIAAADAALELYAGHPAVAFSDLAAEVVTEVRLLRAVQAELAGHVAEREDTYRWVEEWTLKNVTSEQHPFHIHVNDFQVMSVNGRRGRRTIAWPWRRRSWRGDPGPGGALAAAVDHLDGSTPAAPWTGCPARQESNYQRRAGAGASTYRITSGARPDATHEPITHPATPGPRSEVTCPRNDAAPCRGRSCAPPKRRAEPPERSAPSSTPRSTSAAVPAATRASSPARRWW